MATQLVRKGWVGIANETTQFTPVTATDYLPYTNSTLHGVHTPIPDMTARGIRDNNWSSVVGKKWGEGDLEFHFDYALSGYFLGAALGTNAQSALGGGVFSHALSRNNSNQPAESMTLSYDRATVDRLLYAGASVDTLEVSVVDNFIEGKASVKSMFPVTTTSGTGTTVSGSLGTWANYTVQFGSTVSSITSAGPAATKMSAWSFKVNNNVEMTWRSGSNQPASIDYKDFSVDGNYTIFFEGTTDRDAYYNLTKNAMVFIATGNGIGGGNSEKLTLNFYSVRLDAFNIETGLDNFFAEKVTYIAEYSNDQNKTIDGTLINRNSNY